MNEQKAMMQQLWLKAYRADDAIEVPCGNASDAKRFRFAMYDAVKDTRKPGGLVSDELRQAAENCSLSFKEGDGTTIVVRKNILSGIMKSVASILGAEATLPDDVTKAAQESADRAMKLLEQPEPVKKNPFY